jgi:lipid-binding SYLF domain-containing protein
MRILSDILIRRTACPAAAALLLLCGHSDTATRRQQAAVIYIGDAAGAAYAMSQDAAMRRLLARASGVYLVPGSGRGARGAGGIGVLMARKADGAWGNPAFFGLARIVGTEAATRSGDVEISVALLLGPKALDRFRSYNNFSLNTADGGVQAWSAARGSSGHPAMLAVYGIAYNRRLSDAYYGKAITAREAIDGAARIPQADALRRALEQCSSR